jgi:uncharacterized membrane protein YdjX (TVP38/TMEM64 family)
LGQIDITPAAVAEWIKELGCWGPILLGGFIALESIVAPIPGWFFVAATGLLYGFWAGLALSWISALVGAVVAFTLARRFGHRFLYQRIPAKIARRMVDVTENSGFLILLATRLIPYTALDLLSYAAGLTGMRFTPFIAATALGFLPGTAAIVALGDQALAISREETALYLVVVVAAGAGIIQLFTRHRRSHAPRES